MGFAVIDFRSSQNEDFNALKNNPKYNQHGYFLKANDLEIFKKYLLNSSDKNMLTYWYDVYYKIKVFPLNIKDYCHNGVEERHFSNLCILHEIVHAITVIYYNSQGHDKIFLKYLSRVYKNYCKINHLNFSLVSKYMIESYVFRNRTQAQKLLIRDDWYEN